MGVQKQITMILLAVIAVFAGVDHAVQRYIVFPEYQRIDRDNGERQMRTTLAAIEGEIGHLVQLSRAWAVRPEVAAILAAGPDGQEKAARLAGDLAAGRLDFCCLLDRNGRLVWKGGAAADFSPSFDGVILGAPALVGQGGAGRLPGDALDLSGLLRWGSGVALVAAREVAGPKDGAAIGTCLLGISLSGERLAALAGQTGTAPELLWCDSGAPADHAAGQCNAAGCAVAHDPDFATARVLEPAAGLSATLLLRESEGDRLQSLACLPELSGRRTLLLKMLHPMPMTAMGRDVLNGALLALATAGLLIVIVMRESIRLVLVKPLALLTGQVVALRSNDPAAGRISISGLARTGNEVGKLAGELDGMLERLARARRQLVEQSYQSGMTEVASRVMHSLRNALTPITANLGLLREEFRDLPLEQMKLAGLELAGDGASPERREMLNRYLRESIDYLAGVMSDAAGRLKSVDGAVTAIEKILAEQEKFAGRDWRGEAVALPGLVDEVAGLLGLSYYSGVQLIVAPSLAEVGPVSGRRQALLHILANLVSNAIEAIGRTGRLDGRIEIGAEIDTADSPGMVHVTVTDNGGGISPGEIGRIFERGYTTKERDSSGLGLHWCANSVAAMHGRLYAESDGPGRGTVMHLLLPRGGVKRREAVAP